MSNTEIKEIIVALIFAILNTIVAFYITNLLGISNTIILKTFSVTFGDITWEIIIFMGLSLIEALIHEYSNSINF